MLPHTLSSAQISASMITTSLQQLRLDPNPPDTNAGESDSAHSEYNHPAAAPENAHMRPDMAHSHFRPPVPQQHDQLLLERAGQPRAATAGPPQTPPAVFHDAVNDGSSPQDAGMQAVQSVCATGTASQVHVSSSPSSGVAQSQQQLHCSQPHVSQADTPSMHGWRHAHDDSSMLRSAEAQAELERARVVAVERAGPYHIT